MFSSCLSCFLAPVMVGGLSGLEGGRGKKGQIEAHTEETGRQANTHTGRKFWAPVHTLLPVVMCGVAVFYHPLIGGMCVVILSHSYSGSL